MNIRLYDFEEWFSTAQPGATYVYHRGELGRDRRENPNLDELADRVLRDSDCSKPVVSICGHVRNWIHGTGKLRLFTRRERGTIANVAMRR
jgi:hypothetical protein